MKINIFEGARRITYVIVGLWVAGCVGWVMVNEPYATMQYTILAPGSNPLSLTTECGPKDAREFITRKTKDAHDLHISLCFRASTASDGRTLVPYGEPFKDENGRNRIIMNERYSPEVTRYTEQVSQAFSIPAEYADKSEAEYRAARVELWMLALKALLGGIAFIVILMFVTGWIVRGLMGIPYGRDSATNSDTPT